MNKEINADPVGCYEEYRSSKPAMWPQIDVTVWLCAATSKILIADFAIDIYKLYLSKQLECSVRLDVKGFSYDHNWLQSQERLKSGTGRRGHIKPSGSLPTDWADFFWRDEDKEVLF